MKFLFPRLPKNHPASNSIAVNMIANMLGMGWAATPAGLQAMKEAPVYGLRDVAKNLGKQMATEASEEMATEFANTLSDRWIMGDKSNLSQAKEAYQEAGKSPWNAYLDIAKQIGLAGLGGAISGGVMGSGTATSKVFS